MRASQSRSWNSQQCWGISEFSPENLVIPFFPSRALFNLLGGGFLISFVLIILVQQGDEESEAEEDGEDGDEENDEQF